MRFLRCGLFQIEILLSLFLVIGFGKIAKAGNENFPIGSRSAALGGSSVCLSDIWAVGNNQAGLGFLKTITAAAYFDNKFLLKDLSTGAAALAIPLKKAGVIGFSYVQTGGKLYKESKVGFAFSRAFGENISVGLQLNYQGVTIGEGYNSRKGTFTGEVGIQAKMLKRLTLGFHVYNPMMVKMANYNNERVPVIFRLGLLYQFSEKVFVTTECQKDILFKPFAKVGVEYAPVKSVFIRLGIATNPFQNGLGVGLKFGGMRIDVSSTIHPQLGISPQMGLSYAFGKEKSKENENSK
jgi:hypothetical protein